MIRPEIIVNSAKYEVGASTSLQSLLQNLQASYKLEFSSEFKVELNGVKIDTYKETPIFLRELTSEDRVVIFFEHTNKFLSEIIGEIYELILSIEKRLSRNLSQETLPLDKVLDALTVLIESTSYLYKSTKILKNQLAPLPVKELQIHMLSVMKAIETAHNKGDQHMLDDLLEYELKDNLAQWKILVIPKLRQSLTKTF